MLYIINVCVGYYNFPVVQLIYLYDLKRRYSRDTYTYILTLINVKYKFFLITWVCNFFTRV